MIREYYSDTRSTILESALRGFNSSAPVNFIRKALGDPNERLTEPGEYLNEEQHSVLAEGFNQLFPDSKIKFAERTTEDHVEGRLLESKYELFEKRHGGSKAAEFAGYLLPEIAAGMGIVALGGVVSGIAGLSAVAARVPYLKALANPGKVKDLANKLYAGARAASIGDNLTDDSLTGMAGDLLQALPANTVGSEILEYKNKLFDELSPGQREFAGKMTKFVAEVTLMNQFSVVARGFNCVSIKSKKTTGSKAGPQTDTLYHDNKVRELGKSKNVEMEYVASSDHYEVAVPFNEISNSKYKGDYNKRKEYSSIQSKVSNPEHNEKDFSSSERRFCHQAQSEIEIRNRIHDSDGKLVPTALSKFANETYSHLELSKSRGNELADALLKKKGVRKFLDELTPNIMYSMKNRRVRGTLAKHGPPARAIMEMEEHIISGYAKYGKEVKINLLSPSVDKRLVLQYGDKEVATDIVKYFQISTNSSPMEILKRLKETGKINAKPKSNEVVRDFFIKYDKRSAKRKVCEEIRYHTKEIAKGEIFGPEPMQTYNRIIKGEKSEDPYRILKHLVEPKQHQESIASAIGGILRAVQSVAKLGLLAITSLADTGGNLAAMRSHTAEISTVYKSYASSMMAELGLENTKKIESVFKYMRNGLSSKQSHIFDGVDTTPGGLSKLVNRLTKSFFKYTLSESHDNIQRGAIFLAVSKVAKDAMRGELPEALRNIWSYRKNMSTHYKLLGDCFTMEGKVPCLDIRKLDKLTEIRAEQLFGGKVHNFKKTIDNLRIGVTDWLAVCQNTAISAPDYTLMDMIANIGGKNTTVNAVARTVLQFKTFTMALLKNVYGVNSEALMGFSERGGVGVLHDLQRNPKLIGKTFIGSIPTVVATSMGIDQMVQILGHAIKGEEQEELTTEKMLKGFFRTGYAGYIMSLAFTDPNWIASGLIGPTGSEVAVPIAGAVNEAVSGNFVGVGKVLGKMAVKLTPYDKLVKPAIETWENISKHLDPY